MYCHSRKRGKQKTEAEKSCYGNVSVCLNCTLPAECCKGYENIERCERTYEYWLRRQEKKAKSGAWNKLISRAQSSKVSGKNT